MDKDRVAGSAKQIKGGIKEAAGKAAGDAKLKASGQADKTAGKIQNAVGAAKLRRADVHADVDAPSGWSKRRMTSAAVFRESACSTGEPKSVVEMNNSASVSHLAPEFDDFLFAPIGEERNGMMLSVVSALARLDVDPVAGGCETIWDAAEDGNSEIGDIACGTS